jgi:hypothetical protein
MCDRFIITIVAETVPWTKRLLSGLSQGRPAFIPRPGNMGFPVDKLCYKCSQNVLDTGVDLLSQGEKGTVILVTFTAHHILTLTPRSGTT